MNLSPLWAEFLHQEDIKAVHWSTLGALNATDEFIFQYARTHKYIVLTQDLDFSQILFSTAENGPSVILLRIRNEFEQALLKRVATTIRSCAKELHQGALLTISHNKARLRLLPLTQ